MLGGVTGEMRGKLLDVRVFSDGINGWIKIEISDPILHNSNIIIKITYWGAQRTCMI
jgi:hypothetical protein